MSRLWVIAYDIADNKRRRLAANCLGTAAQRVQESVFEGWLSPTEAGILAGKLEDLIDKTEDAVRFYPAGGLETGRRQTLGAMANTAQQPAHWIF